MRRVRIPPSDLEAWLHPIHTAATVEALEAAFQAKLTTGDGQWVCMTKKLDRAVREAVAARGWALIAQDPLREEIPQITCRPRSYKVTFQGQTATSGTWGNGAGHRWARQGLLQWLLARSTHHDEALMRNIVDWVCTGFPHRALLLVRRAQAA